MPLDTAGKIAYKEVPLSGGVRFQADPPVCNVCQQEITRQNFGVAGVEGRGRTQETFEFIECTACTLIRQSGDALKRFLAQHHL